MNFESFGQFLFVCCCIVGAQRFITGANHRGSGQFTQSTNFVSEFGLEGPNIEMFFSSCSMFCFSRDNYNQYPYIGTLFSPEFSGKVQIFDMIKFSFIVLENSPDFRYKSICILFVTWIVMLLIKYWFSSFLQFGWVWSTSKFQTIRTVGYYFLTFLTYLLCYFSLKYSEMS